MPTPTTPPRFRRDLVATAIEADGVQYVEVKDTGSGRSFRFYDFEHTVATSFDGRSLAAISADLRARVGMELSAEQLGAFADELGQLGFLEPEPLDRDGGWLGDPPRAASVAPVGAERAPSAAVSQKPPVVAPVGGAAVVAPVGGAAVAPVGGAAVAPVGGAPAVAPVGGAPAVAPVGGAPAVAPVGGAPAVAPVGGAPAVAPVGGAPAVAPVGGAPAVAPVGGAPAVAPVGGAPAVAPVGGAPAVAPVGGAAASGAPAVAPVGGAPVATAAAGAAPPTAPLAIAPAAPVAISPFPPALPDADLPALSPRVATPAPGGAPAPLPPEAFPAPFPLSVTPAPLTGEELAASSPSPVWVRTRSEETTAKLIPSIDALQATRPRPEPTPASEAKTPPIVSFTGASARVLEPDGGSDPEEGTPTPPARPMLRIVASNGGPTALELPPPPIDRKELGLDEELRPAAPAVRAADLPVPVVSVPAPVAAPPPAKPRRRAYTAALVVGSVAICGAAVVLGVIAFRVPVNTDPPPVPVKTVVPAPTSVYRYFERPAGVKSAPGSALSFSTGGKVVELSAPGTRFDPGAILGLLGPGRVLRDQIAHEQTRIAHYEQLLEKSKTAGNKAEARQAALKLEKKQTAMTKWRADLEKVAIIPAEAGEVAETLVSVGATVSAGAPALRIKGTALRAEIELARDEARTLRQLPFCRIEIGGTSFECTIAAQAGDETHVVLDLPADPKITAGKTGQVARARYDAVFVLPPSALVHVGGVDRVFVANAHGRAEAHPVVVVDKTGDEVVVTQGLDVGDRVIVDPPHDLRPDARLQLVGSAPSEVK